MPFVHRLRVRFHECDPQGVVFYAHYFAYVDVALTEMWREAFGSYGDVVAAGTDVVVVEAASTFRASARFDDDLDVELRIEWLGTTSTGGSCTSSSTPPRWARRRSPTTCARLSRPTCRSLVA